MRRSEGSLLLWLHCYVWAAYLPCDVYEGLTGSLLWEIGFNYDSDGNGGADSVGPNLGGQQLSVLNIF